MASFSRSPGKDARSGQRGAGVLEAAIVAPVFFLLIFGIMEMGLLFRNYLTLGSSVTDAARTAAIRGNDADADFQILQAFRQSFAAWDLKDFEYIVIFEADGPGAQVPASCKGVGGASNDADNCNRYDVADLFRPMADGSDVNFGGCPTDLDSLDAAWCPISRDTDLSGTGDDAGVDLIGIYVEAKHKYVTGFFADTGTLSYTQVIRLEPSTES